MTVYVLEAGEYEDRHILGIYSTQEKANKNKTEWDQDCNNTSMLGNAIITEYEVDE